MTHCFADRLKQTLAARGVRPFEYIQTAFEHGHRLQRLVPVSCIAGPLAEFSDPGTEGVCTSLRRRMAVVRNRANQVDCRLPDSCFGAAVPFAAAGWIFGLFQAIGQNAIKAVLVKIDIAVQFDDASDQFEQVFQLWHRSPFQGWKCDLENWQAIPFSDFTDLAKVTANLLAAFDAQLLIDKS